MTENKKMRDFEKFSVMTEMEYFKELDDTRRCIAHYPTGFPYIDQVTGGGLEAGFGILSGVSGAGKTTFVTQLAYNLSKQDYPVIIFSLEQESRALIAKTLSMQSYKKGKRLFTANEILSTSLLSNISAADKEVYRTIAQECKDVMKNVLIVDRPKLGREINGTAVVEFVRDYMIDTGKRPIVIVDYLQRLAPTDDTKRGSKMDIIDANTNLLWDLAHTEGLCVLAISSLNRNSYKEGATLEGQKGSGNIEYSADFAIGLQFAGFDNPDFNFNQAKQANPRDIEIVIMKQRLAAAGEPIPFTYYPAYNIFVENKVTNADATKAVDATKNVAVESATPLINEATDTIIEVAAGEKNVSSDGQVQSVIPLSVDVFGESAECVDFSLS